MSVKRALRELKGFVFDLDGCVWTGEVLVPGAAEVLAFLRRQDRGVCFLTNNSRARARTMQAKLARLGVEAAIGEVLTPLEILGELVRSRWGRARALAIGGEELTEALAAGGHELVSPERYREATVVVVGNDFDLSYARLTAAARAVAAGAAFVTPNLDPRLPVEGDDFLPGCGAIVEAVAVAAGVRPFVVGKPEPPLFERALTQMGLAAEDAAMVGDSVDSDIRGARRVGMSTVLFAPRGGPDGVAHYMVRTMGQLRRLLGDRLARPRSGRGREAEAEKQAGTEKQAGAEGTGDRADNERG